MLVGERIGQGVELHAAADRHGGDDLRTGHEAAGLGVAVVAFGEVAVKAGDDRVGAVGVVGVAGPLSDAGSAGVGQHDPTDVFELLKLSVALYGKADLLRAGSDGKLTLHLQPLLFRLAGQTSGAVQVFVARVGATADEPYLQNGRKLELVHRGGELADGKGAVRGVGTVDVRF